MDVTKQLCIQISTTRPPFRVGYRRRSTTTPRPTTITSSSGTETYTSTASPKVSKPNRRKLLPGRTTTGRPVESQVVPTTQSPTKITNRFKFVSRKPYLRTTTAKSVSANTTTDQNLESTNQETLNDSTTAITELTEIATVLQKVQQAPIPQAKPSRKRPQILRLSSQYSAKATTQKPSATSSTTLPETTYVITKSYNTSPRTAAKYTNKKTVAITMPFLRGTYVTPQGEVYSTLPPLTADKYVTNIGTGTPLVSEIYNIPQTITAQDFVNRYTSSPLPPTRSRSRFQTTEAPVIIITPGQSGTTRRRKPVQAFEKVLSKAEAKNNYRPVAEYDYYDNVEASILGRIPEHSKVLLHSNGIIECLDQGNFPHPVSCKKFISCAKMDNDKIIGWEYTCPKNLSFDPIGGMCNWSAGLGCNES